MNRYLILIFMMIATAFSGELKMNPFHEGFRISFGSACFFFGLLWFQSLRITETGFIVGLFLVVFRAGLDVEQYGGHYVHQMYEHIPSLIYYTVFALVLGLAEMRSFLDKPLIVGIIGMGADLLANSAELATWDAIESTNLMGLHTLLLVLLLGCIRSFFVVGVYNMLMIRQVRALGEQQQSQIAQLLLINSSLHEEGFYLKKSMRQIEEVTRQSYALYRQLKSLEKEDPRAADLSCSALQIAEHVHEVKKDSQRILAGLLKVMQQEETHEMISLKEVGELVVQANHKYAKMLGKEITFDLQCEVFLTTNRLYDLISILNNLVANSVEAIHEGGHIGLTVKVHAGQLEWHVVDDGPGISAEEIDFVFQPGYTTKYDAQGYPSTGIGLSHCVDLAGQLGGVLEHEPTAAGTHFVMRMPLTGLLRKEEKE